MDLTSLRHLHEGSLFLLKRYSALEALISAVNQGRTENQAFGIGASSVVPGAGQIINGDYLQGGLLLFASGLSSTTIRHLEYTRQRLPASDESLLPWYYASLTLRNGIVTYAMLHAANVSYRERRDRTYGMWTGMASMVPGVGQAINGDWWEGAAFFVGWTLSAVLTAHFEQALFQPGEDPYHVVNDPENSTQWNVAWACLPGGAGLSFSKKW